MITTRKGRSLKELSWEKYRIIQNIKCLFGFHLFNKRLWEFPEDKSWLIDIHTCRCCGMEKEKVLRRPPAQTIVIEPKVKLIKS